MHPHLRPARATVGALLPSLLLGVSLTACAGRPAPATAPIPVVVQSAPAAGGSARDSDVSRVPSGSATGAASGTTRDSAGISRQDITREAVNVFGDSVAADSASEHPMGEGDSETVSWDIDVRSFETHERVDHYVRYFSGAARERIQNRLEIGSRYEPMIRAKFRAAGIPEDMYYLGLIESGYDNNAYSRAAAVGMWQFMASTARDLGMRVDWWVDERRDPVKATEGATRFLRWLNEQLGSFYLAAAAYNGGPGRVARGLTRYAADMEGETGDEKFFSLAEQDYLPRETKEYVPQLIAAALVGKNPSHYGMTLTPREPFSYDSVRVGPALPLAAAAKAAGVTTGEIIELNPHVLRGMTPPKDAMWLRVPPGHAIGFDSALATLGDDEKKAYRRIESKKGQTPASVAREYGITARQLGWYNRKLEIRKKTGTLVPGQLLLIPSPSVVAAARDIPDPSVEKYGSSKAGAAKYYVVKRGDNLGLIARRNGTTVANLKRLNRLKRDIVLPGQTLLVKGTAPRSGSTRMASKSSSSKSSSRKTTVAAREKSSLPALSTKAKSRTTKKATTKKAPVKKTPTKKAPAKKKP